MAARKRKDSESLKRYHKNLKQEQQDLDWRLSPAYAFSMGKGIFTKVKEALKRAFPQMNIGMNKPIDIKKRQKARKAQRQARRVTRRAA